MPDARKKPSRPSTPRSPAAAPPREEPEPLRLEEHPATGLVLYTGDIPDPETAGTADEYLRRLHGALPGDAER